jgi:putative RNA 2'-phosphotransferase
VTIDYTRLSKMVARALRHAPEQFGLELDEQGWTPVQNLLAALRKRRPEWKGLGEADLATMIEHSSKRRYEMRDGRIRAYYGHSVQEKIQKTSAEPPETLYHGTTVEAARLIRREGLRPMNRQYVHLSTDPATARLVGRRRSAEPVILEIRAADAHRTGVRFYPGNEDVWLADGIPPDFIKAP